MQHPNSTSDASYFGYHDMGMRMGGSALTFPEVSPWTLPHSFGPVREPDPFGGLLSNMRMPFGYDGVQCPSGSAPFGLHSAELTPQEVIDAKALAASKSHSEAERRRRERINNHLAKLRSLLPNTTKTDKASLLAEVIQHVKDLKRQTSSSVVSDRFPTETDELTVDEYASPSDGWMIRASICCDDRSDLLPDLINALKALRLRTLKAEIMTLGERVKNVLFVTSEGGDDGDEEQQQYSIRSIEEALRAVMEKVVDESAAHAKRQRTTNINY